MLWSIAVAVSVAPWIAATLLLWVYVEVFEQEPADDTNKLKISWVMAILHTVSPLVYLTYILSAIVSIGLAGRRNLFSFCCLATGIPVFTLVPTITGVALLYVALSSGDKLQDGAAEEMMSKGFGIATGVACLLSTVMCLYVVCLAIMCGSKGRGKDHQYPTPLAYFPFLRDFKATRTEGKVEDGERYTADYPPPCYTFSERKSISQLPWIRPPPKSTAV